MILAQSGAKKIAKSHKVTYNFQALKLVLQNTSNIRYAIPLCSTQTTQQEKCLKMQLKLSRIFCAIITARIYSPTRLTDEFEHLSRQSHIVLECTRKVKLVLYITPPNSPIHVPSCAPVHTFLLRISCHLPPPTQSPTSPK